MKKGVAARNDVLKNATMMAALKIMGDAMTTADVRTVDVMQNMMMLVGVKKNMRTMCMTITGTRTGDVMMASVRRGVKASSGKRHGLTMVRVKAVVETKADEIRVHMTKIGKKRRTATMTIADKKVAGAERAKVTPGMTKAPEAKVNGARRGGTKVKAMRKITGTKMVTAIKVVDIRAIAGSRLAKMTAIDLGAAIVLAVLLVGNRPAKMMAIGLGADIVLAVLLVGDRAMSALVANTGDTGNRHAKNRHENAVEVEEAVETEMVVHVGIETESVTMMVKSLSGAQLPAQAMAVQKPLDRKL